MTEADKLLQRLFPGLFPSDADVTPLEAISMYGIMAAGVVVTWKLLRGRRP